MAQKILITNIKAETRQTTTFKEMETSEEARENAQQTRKRHRQDTLPIETSIQARETQSAVRPLKRDRR